MDDLAEAIRGKRVTTAVVGLGYVGLAVACALAHVGFRVLGIERDEDKAAQIGAGISPIGGREPRLRRLLKEALETGNLTVSTEASACAEAVVVLIAVETPVAPHSKAPTYEALKGALRGIGPHLQPGALVIVESTIAPGTMEGVVKPLLEETSGLRMNRDLHLVYCPERVMPGKLVANLRKCDRVIGGMTPEAAELAKELYQHLVKADLDLTDALTAELVKAAENTYRDVQIAFANEMALLCENVGADVYRVRELVNKSPLRAMHLPGAGVGGHCIPKDPWLLLHGTKGTFQAELIPTARGINDGMPLHVAQLAQEVMAEAGKDVQGARVAVLGYAYLENAADARNSPTIPLAEQLESLGATVTIHDPYFEEFDAPLEETITGSDCLILMVAHDSYRDLHLIDLKAWLATPVLIDGRNLFDKKEARDLGFFYAGVGNR
jgi:UDP-N-acetyl-D-mannosaminuronic acid dehydrogenase